MSKTAASNLFGSTTMPEPTTSAGAAAAAFGFKSIGGMAGALSIGAGLAATVVMCMTPPRSKREWVVGIISTVVGSICGGAALIERFSLQTWMTSFTGLLSVLGMVFACGLPAWAVVRWTFNWMAKRQEKDIGEIYTEIRAQIPVGGFQPLRREVADLPAQPPPRQP